MLRKSHTWHKLFPEEIPRIGSCKQKREKQADRLHLLVIDHLLRYQPILQNARTEKGKKHIMIILLFQRGRKAII